MEVLSGIHLIRASYTNVYLVISGDEAVLIDAGPPGSEDIILEYLEKLGISPGLLIATHSHWDHMGGAAELRRRLGVPVAAHRLEAAYISSGRPPLGKTYQPVPVERILEDNDRVAGLRVVHTPGHTPGSICLFDETRSIIFIGDLAYEQDGDLYEIPAQYSLDPGENRRSLRKIAGLGARHVMPSHGNPLINSGGEKLRQLVERLRDE